MMILRLLLSLALAASCCQCSFFPGKSSVTRNITYTPDHWPAPVRANLYQALPTADSEKRPAVILIHGGGFRMKDLRWQMAPIARKLAARGYFVMNLTYRNPPGWIYPAPMDDVRTAIDWIIENADAQNIDPSRIATFGYSAGGHLALLNGLRDPRVKAIVAGAAPSDLMLFEGGKLVHDFIGGTRAEQPQRYRDASPVFQVNENSPPVFLYHGTADSLVPPMHAWMIKGELDAAGVPNELFWLEGKGHVGTFIFAAPAVDRAIDFLDRTLARPHARD